jgi:hypothetical protein
MSRRTTCRCSPTIRQPKADASGTKCTSRRRSATTSPRRRPRARHNTMNRSRADRHALTRASTSAFSVRSMGLSGTGSRCRARAIPREVTRSPRSSSGSHRSSIASYSTASNALGAAPQLTPYLQNSRTAANTAFTRRGPRSPALCSHNTNAVSRYIADHGSNPTNPAHVRYSANARAYASVVAYAQPRPNRTCRRNSSTWLNGRRSPSSTVQYTCRDGSRTGNARTTPTPE